jgi:hypothetical protein
VRADATEAVTALADATRDSAEAGPPAHWSGCERRCGAPAVPYIDVLATGAGYRVRRGEQEFGTSGDVGEVTAWLRAAREHQ